MCFFKDMYVLIVFATFPAFKTVLFVYGFPTVPISFFKKTIISSLKCTAFLSKNQLAVLV